MKTVTLPNGWKLKCKPTGVFERIWTLPDGTLFEYENQIWEKLPQSNANLSDFNDESEIVVNSMVQIYEVERN